MARKTLGQIAEAAFWECPAGCGRSWQRAAAAVEAEVLRRLESEGRLGTPIKELRKALGKAKH